MYKVEDVKKMIGSVSEEKLNSAVSKGALKLSDDQINAVSFVFWGLKFSSNPTRFLRCEISDCMIACIIYFVKDFFWK
jgi:hypothetical protein